MTEDIKPTPHQILYLTTSRVKTSKRKRKLTPRFRLFDDKLPGEKQRVFWSSKENELLLSVIEKMQVVKALVRKRQKNADIFMAVERRMMSEGSNKTWQQIRSRWKRMKSEYIREKRYRNSRQLRNTPVTVMSDSTSFDTMTHVLGKYADVIECTSAYLGEEDDDGLALRMDYDDEDNDMDGEDASDGNVQVQVELIEGEAALEQSMTVEEDSEIRVIKPEPLSPLRSSPELPEVSEPTTSSTQEERFKNTTDNETRSTASTKSSPPTVKTFATEYARKHAQCLRDYHEQFQEWYERQMRSQQHWEENFMREQMELTKSMLENVTSTFLQGMQQVMQSVMGSLNRRSMTPFVPSFPSRNGIELNGLTLNHADLPLFLSSDPTPNGPTVISSQSLIEDR